MKRKSGMEELNNRVDVLCYFGSIIVCTMPDGFNNGIIAHTLALRHFGLSTDVNNRYIDASTSPTIIDYIHPYTQVAIGAVNGVKQKGRSSFYALRDKTNCAPLFFNPVGYASA
jgi:hypothetical protein